MKRVSKNFRVIRAVYTSLVAVIAYMIVGSYLPSFFGYLVAFLFGIYALVGWMAVDFYFDEGGVRVGRTEFPFGRIVNIWRFGFNHDNYLIFKFSDEPFISRYRIVNVNIWDGTGFLLLLIGKNNKSRIEELGELIRDKSNLPYEKKERLFGQS